MPHTEPKEGNWSPTVSKFTTEGHKWAWGEEVPWGREEGMLTPDSRGKNLLPLLSHLLSPFFSLVMSCSGQVWVLWEVIDWHKFHPAIDMFAIFWANSAWSHNALKSVDLIQPKSYDRLVHDGFLCDENKYSHIAEKINQIQQFCRNWMFKWKLLMIIN